MNQPIDIWSFVVRVTSIGLDVKFELKNAELVRHESLRIEGNVVVGQELIEGTTVYAEIWAGDDQIARKAHEEGVLGSASVSKDVMNVRTFSSKDPLQIAGIDIHVPLLQAQFRELQDSLALAESFRDDIPIRVRWPLAGPTGAPRGTRTRVAGCKCESLVGQFSCKFFIIA
jgi:hypothetical protein